MPECPADSQCCKKGKQKEKEEGMNISMFVFVIFADKLSFFACEMKKILITVHKQCIIINNN